MNKSIITIQQEKIVELQARVNELETMPLRQHPGFDAFSQSLENIIEKQNLIINELQAGGKCRRRFH